MGEVRRRDHHGVERGFGQQVLRAAGEPGFGRERCGLSAHPGIRLEDGRDPRVRQQSNVPDVLLSHHAAADNAVVHGRCHSLPRTDPVMPRDDPCRTGSLQRHCMRCQGICCMRMQAMSASPMVVPDESEPDLRHPRNREADLGALPVTFSGGRRDGRTASRFEGNAPDVEDPFDLSPARAWPNFLHVGSGCIVALNEIAEPGRLSH